MNRFIIAAFVAASCLVYRASAQEVNTNPVELPSATVWEFVKYNNAAANLYTGTVCIEIPVYTYEDSDFTIPVSLGYSSNGFKPNIQAPAAGHEWSLNAGGTVTRIVRGLPDEERNLSTFGFMETHNDSTLTGVGQLDGFTTGWDNDGIEAVSPTLFYAPYGWDNTSMLFDMEPDIFYFNFLGYSGKFQLGYDGAVHFYDTTSPAYSREYSYLDSEGYSSGNLAPMPRYGLSYTRSTPPNENISVFLGSYNDLLPSDGTHIGYSRVVETLPEGSNEYRFISYRDCPDGKVTNMEYTNINNYLYDVTCNRNLSGTDARNAIMALMSPTISMESKRGKLLSKRSFDKNGDMVASQTTSYESYTYAYESLDKIWNLQSLYIGATRVATVIGDIRPVSVSTRISGVTETENYSYDSFRNLKTVVKDGKTSRFLYVQDLDDIEAFDDMVSASYWNSFRSTATARTMKRLNMVNLPLQEEIYDKNGILSIRRYNYGYRNASDTSLVVVKSIESYDQTSERWETVSHFDYDSLGNLVEATDPDGVSTVYIWGHGGLHLVAAVGNATIEQVEDASLLLPMFPGGPSRIVFPLSGIREAPVSGALSPLQEDALRSIPGAEVSSYAWQPLVGLLSATDPSGRTTSGKLRRVLDPLARPTAAWLYSPDDRLRQ